MRIYGQLSMPEGKLGSSTKYEEICLRCVLRPVIVFPSGQLTQ